MMEEIRLLKKSKTLVPLLSCQIVDFCRSKLEKLNSENASLKEELNQLKEKNNTYQVNTL